MKKTNISVYLPVKISLLIVASVFAVYAAKAQSSEFQPYYSFGTSHGISMASMKFFPNVIQSQLTGYTGGVAANYISEKNFGLQVELNYSQRGWKEKEATTGATYQRRLNYFEMPVLTHFYLGDKFKWILNIGPKIGYLLSESSQNAITSASHPEYTMPVKNKFDYGLCAGSGFELQIGTTSYTLEARYSFSFSDIFSNARKDFFDSSANRVVAITLGVFFQHPAQRQSPR